MACQHYETFQQTVQFEVHSHHSVLIMHKTVVINLVFRDFGPLECCLHLDTVF